MYVHDWYKCVSSGRPVSRLRVEPWNYPPISESCYNYPHQLPPPSMRPLVSLCCSFVLSHIGIVTMTWPYIITMFRVSKNLDSASLHFFADENCKSSNTFTFLFSSPFLKVRFQNRWYSFITLLYLEPINREYKLLKLTPKLFLDFGMPLLTSIASLLRISVLAELLLWTFTEVLLFSTRQYFVW